MNLNGKTTLDEIVVMTESARSNGKFPSLARLKYLNGGDVNESTALVLLMLDSITSFYGAEWSQQQMASAAETITNTYYILTPIDLKAIVQRSLSGQFGEVYGKLSPNVLIQWIKHYCEMRGNAYQEYNDRKHSDFTIMKNTFTPNWGC